MPTFRAHALSLRWGEYIDSCLHRGVGSYVAFYSTCKKKSAIYMLSIAHLIIPACGRVKLRNSYMLFNCCIQNWRLFSLRGSFVLCITTWPFRTCSQLFCLHCEITWNSIQIGGTITFPCCVWRVQMRNVYTEKSEKLVKTIFHTRHLEMMLMVRRSGFSQSLETFHTMQQYKLQSGEKLLFCVFF